MDKKMDKLCKTLNNLYKLPAISELSGFLEGETAFLIVLKNYGDAPATPSKLSDDLAVTKGRITAIINSLTRKEMLRLEKIEGDRRKINVRITEKGLKYIEEKLESIEDYVKAFEKNFGSDNIEKITALLEEATAAVEKTPVTLIKSTGGGAL